MSRFKRKQRDYTLLKIKSKGGLPDLFDNVIKELWYITDYEYDLILEKMSDEEMDLFLTENPTFTQKRYLLNLVDKYIDLQEYRDSQLSRLV